MPNDPVHLVRRGKKWCVMGVNAKGSPGKGRCFSSKTAAKRQLTAINLGMIRTGKIKPKGGIPAIARKPAPRRKKR